MKRMFGLILREVEWFVVAAKFILPFLVLAAGWVLLKFLGEEKGG